jgi:CelD/BcsL family acetyltransferase involved in cellulose biosynthesis
MTAGGGFVETASWAELAAREEAWRDLARRAAEPNPFAESAFLPPALRLAGAGLEIWLVWSDVSRAMLIAILVLRGPQLGLGLARIWRSEQAGLAAMMFDATRCEAALEAVMARLSSRRAVAGLILPGVEPEGPLARAIRATASRSRSRVEATGARRRAALIFEGANFEASQDKKRRKEWTRQARRLAERGRLELRLTRGAEAIERFLALEASGWKGARGTALGVEPARAAFARAMLAGFADQGRLQVHELALGGSPVAMGIVLRAGARAFYWKTAYDEAFAEYSPGVQLTLELSRRLAREPGLALVDSCALQDHPMIDRIWPGRIELVDFALAAGPPRGWLLAGFLAWERAWMAFRERAKRIVVRMRGGKRS